MEVDYYSKYIKYKAKYIELKNQMGGTKKCCLLCNCIEYKVKDEGLYDQKCTCGHIIYNHYGKKDVETGGKIGENYRKECINKKDKKTETACCYCNCGKFEEGNFKKGKSFEKTPDKCKCHHPLNRHLTKEIKKCDKLP